jgi:hypothetical protein
MANLPDPDKREIITRAPFVDEQVGEMVAHLLHGNAEIDVEIKPVESDTYARIGINVKEARKLAADLVRIADVAEAAMWTPELLADVRTLYLPGATDAEIIARLTVLVEQHGGGIELRSPGRLFHADGEALTAAAHREKVDRVAAAMSAAQVSLTEMLSVVADLRTIYPDPEDQT